MSTHGDVGGFDLVQQMQPKANLQTCWIMLDQVKFVNGWTTLAYDVYDLVYYKVMAIVVYDM